LTKVGVLVPGIVELDEGAFSFVCQGVVESVVVAVFDNAYHPNKVGACVMEDFEFHFTALQIQ